MGVSDRIEAFINELMRQQEDEGEWTEIGRNELASIFGCVPSQINYVISTRFSPERGYDVQSRRGGGGCIRIRRIYLGDDIIDAASHIGDSIDRDTAGAIVRHLYDAGTIDRRTAEVMISAVSDAALPIANPQRNMLRASIMKSMLAAAAKKL